MLPATMLLPEEVQREQVPEGMLAFWWLYQAGIIVKSPGGALLAIDPYLSNSAFYSYQQVRAVPAPLDPGAVQLDALLATHSHEDHLDPGSLLAFMAHEETRFIGPPMAVDKVLAAGVAGERTIAVHRGDRAQIGDITVVAVHARHDFAPEPTPDAVGYLIEHGGTRLYHSGDTEYDAEIVSDTMRPSVSLIAINGTAGNMNAHEAAMLAWRQQTRLAVPFHYGLWVDSGYGEGATIDPANFTSTFNRLDPDGKTLVLTPCRRVLIGPDGLVE